MAKEFGKKIKPLKVISESELIALGKEGIINYSPYMFEKDYKTFKNIAFQLGCKTHSPTDVEIDELTHRNALGEVVKCRRYVLAERTDYKWLHSKYASMDALFADADEEIKKDMQEMSKQLKYDINVKAEEV